MTNINPSPVPERFAVAIERFIRVQEGRNRSPQTLRAYRSDLSQLAGWLHQDNPFLLTAVDVTTGPPRRVRCVSGTQARGHP